LAIVLGKFLIIPDRLKIESTIWQIKKVMNGFNEFREMGCSDIGSISSEITY